MNKIVIPAILVATILIAGIFALAPVEKAATVHTTIISDLQGTSILTDTAVKVNLDVANAAGTTLIDVSVNQDFTAEIGQFFVTVADENITIEDIRILNANDVEVEIINFADIVVGVGSEIVFPQDIHSNISLPANWSVIVRGQSASGAGDITVMLGIITQGDATVTIA